MRTAVSLIWLLMLLTIAPVCAENPPDNIIKHYEWCRAPKTAGERITRFKGFWDRFHPENGDYEDGVHINYVRLSAYRLAELYADAKKSKECREMLAWLEASDQSVSK